MKRRRQQRRMKQLSLPTIAAPTTSQTTCQNCRTCLRMLKVSISDDRGFCRVRLRPASMPPDKAPHFSNLLPVMDGDGGGCSSYRLNPDFSSRLTTALEVTCLPIFGPFET